MENLDFPHGTPKTNWSSEDISYLPHGKLLSGFSVVLVPVTVNHRFTVQFNYLRIYALGLKCSSLAVYGKRHVNPHLALK